MMCFSCLFCFPGYAQADKKDKARQVNVTLATSLIEYLSLSGLSTGNFNLGTDVNFHNGKSVFVNLGYIRSYGPSGGMLEVNALSTQGLRLQLEARKYLGKHELIEPLTLIFWPQLFQYHSRTLSNTGYYLALNAFGQHTNTSLSDYTVKRNAVGLHFKAGYQCIGKSGFILILDHGIGLGLQYVSSHSEGTGEFSHFSVNGG